MNRQATEGYYLACHLAAVSDPQTGDAKYPIVLVPDGQVDSKSGRFVVDKEAARLVIEEFESHGVMRPIDWEHQGLGGEYSSPTGQAPAAGWISKIHYEPQVGLIGDVWWTEEARELIRAKKYLYISPVTVVRKEDLRVIEIPSAALTNTPAIPRMEALAAKYSLQSKEATTMPEPVEQPTAMTEGDPRMAIARIAEALEITDVPDAQLPEAILEAVRKLKGKGEKKGEEAEGEGAEGEKAVASKAVVSKVRVELGLKEDAGADAILLALSTLKDRATLQWDVQKEIAELKAKDAAREADDLIDSAVKANKLNPKFEAQMAYARKLAQSNPEEFNEWMTCQQPYATPGRTTAPPRGAGGGGSAEDTLIANSLKEHKGNYKEAFIALQTHLVRERTSQGFANKAAREQCQKQYPKIFGETT